MNVATKTLDMAHPIASTLVVAWHWKDSTIPLMQGAFTRLTKLAETEHRFMDKYYAVTASNLLSDAGKKSAIEEAFSTIVAPVYRDAQLEGQSMKNMIASLKANSLPRVDPTDVAGAMTRSDIRRIFLSMDPIKKQVAIKSNPSKQLAAALLEFPPELLGLTPQDVAELTASFGESAYPENARQIDELTDGLDVVKTLLRLAMVVAVGKLRMTEAQVEALIWGGVLPDSKKL